MQRWSRRQAMRRFIDEGIIFLSFGHIVNCTHCIGDTCLAGKSLHESYLEEERIAGLLLNGCLHARGVSHQQVIAHHLQQPLSSSVSA